MKEVSDRLQIAPKENTIIVSHTAFIDGMMILQKMVPSEAPSIRADSSTESGKPSRFCLIRYKPMGYAAAGMMRAMYLSTQPRLEMRIYWGRNTTSYVNSRAKTTRLNKKFLPTKLCLAKG